MRSSSSSFLRIFTYFVIVINVKLKTVNSETTEILINSPSTTPETIPGTPTVQDLKTTTDSTSLLTQHGMTTLLLHLPNETQRTTGPPKLTKTATQGRVMPITVLEYVPITSFYHPHPVTLGQIVSPGTPWPDTPLSVKPTKQPTKPTKQSTPQTTFPPNLVDRFPELTTLNKKSTTATIKGTKETPSTTENYVKPQTVLEYVPISSFHHPNRVTPAQIIPPGKPWPASAEESLSSTKLSSLQTTTMVNLNERLPDLITTTVKQTEIPVINTKKTTLSFASQTPPLTHTVLTYKPQRPWYHPRPGNTVTQIIPPGKPWPASREEYSTFSVTTHSPWLKESNENSEENPSFSHSKLDKFQFVKDETSLEPNALQYYGPRITAPSKPVTPMTLYTSGMQKTTLSDIADILKEVHDITSESGNPLPSPSLLLPFDTNKNSPLSSPTQNRRNPIASQHHLRGKTNVARVYDGTLALNDPTRKDRIFMNPKFDPK